MTENNSYLTTDLGLTKSTDLSQYAQALPDQVHYIIIARCPLCQGDPVPFLYTNETLPRTYCLNCHQIAKVVPKGYITPKVLEESGWESEV